MNPNGCSRENPCKTSPSIIVPGIGQSETELYRNGKPTGIKGSTIYFDTENLKLRPVIASLLGSLLLQHDVGLTKSVYKLAAAALEPQRVGKDGKFVNDIRTIALGRLSEMEEKVRNTSLNSHVPLHELMEYAGEDHVYFFSFNLVDEVWNSIDLLDKYIDKVRKETGHDKVNLINVSLGGTLFTGYLEKYGHKKLDQVVNVVSCADGTDMFADLFSRKVNRAESFFYRDYIPTVFESERLAGDGWNKTLGYSMNLLIRMLPNKVFEGVISALWGAALDTIMVNCTQFWAMIPCDRYDEIARMHLSGPERAGLKKKTDAYHNAQLNLASNIKKAAAAGVHINNIAGANLYFGEGEYTFFQAVESIDKINGDGIIGVRNAGLGATGAAPGKTLEEEGYKPRKAGYLSPDGKVDCSTCILPDNTWVFLDQPHEAARNDAVLHLASALIKNPGMNIRTNPKQFPQFNPAMRTHELRRNRINDAKALLKDDKLDEDAKKELRAAIQEGEAVRALTVGDAKRAEAAIENLNGLLRKYGSMSKPFEQSRFQKRLETFTGFLSRMALYYYGKHGYVEGGSIRRFRKKIQGG